MIIGKLNRISEILTSEETFDCEMYYTLTWLATLDEVADYNRAKEDGRPYEAESLPQLMLLNKVEGDHEMCSYVRIDLVPIASILRFFFAVLNYRHYFEIGQRLYE